VATEHVGVQADRQRSGLDEDAFSEILVEWKQSEEVTQENSKLTEIADKVSTKIEELAKEVAEEETKEQVKGFLEKMKEKLSGLFDWL
jgi:5'-deoxynucleotidase YfbR-like HD superfamily hydrolase